MEASYAVALLTQVTMLTNDCPSSVGDADARGSITMPTTNHHRLTFATPAIKPNPYIDQGYHETGSEILAKYANDLSILDAESYFHTTDSMVAKEARKEAARKKARGRPRVNTKDETAIDVSCVEFTIQLRSYFSHKHWIRNQLC